MHGRTTGTLDAVNQCARKTVQQRLGVTVVTAHGALDPVVNKAVPDRSGGCFSDDVLGLFD
jgi:hypothetical protein